MPALCFHSIVELGVKMCNKELIMYAQNLRKMALQSNLDYSKCQGLPDFLQIIGSSNFRNRYFSTMFGSFRLVIIFDCISNKNGEQGIISNL